MNKQTKLETSRKKYDVDIKYQIDTSHQIVADSQEEANKIALAKDNRVFESYQNYDGHYLSYIVE